MAVHACQAGLPGLNKAPPPVLSSLHCPCLLPLADCSFCAATGMIAVSEQDWQQLGAGLALSGRSMLPCPSVRVKSEKHSTQFELQRAMRRHSPIPMTYWYAHALPPPSTPPFLAVWGCDWQGKPNATHLDDARAGELGLAFLTATQPP